MFCVCVCYLRQSASERKRERGGEDPIEQVFAAPKNVSSQIPLLSSNIDLVKTILSVFNFPKCSKKVYIS